MKKDEKGEELLFEKVMELYTGISLWKVNIERCREQDKNARVMDKQTFDRLKLNIEQDKRLESLPYGIVIKNPAGNEEFNIISGHHRIRAARSAGVTEIFVMVQDDEITEDQIKAKQLAHNAIAGEDDIQVLKEIYDSIEDIDQKIKSGVRQTDFDKQKFRTVPADEISLDFDFRVVKFMFLSSQIEKLDAVVEEIQENDKVYLASMSEFEKLNQSIREVSKREDIRNIASIVDRMCEIVKDYYRSRPEDETEE